MAKVQFALDDTTPWAEEYGDGSDGDLDVSSPGSYSPTKTTGYYSDTDELTVNDNSSFSIGDIVLIHQTRDSALYGEWMLNVVTAKPSGKLTLKYALTQTFVDSGDDLCQIIKVPQYKTVTIDDTYTLNTFSATTGGGVAIIMANKAIGGSGTIYGLGKGFQGAPTGVGGGPGYEQQGYSYADNVIDYGASANEGAGGGGKKWAGGGAGGGGGSHGGSGNSGQTFGGADDPGDPGNTYGQADCERINPGSGGGAGGGDADNPAAFTGGAGGRGGACLILIAPQVDISSLTINLNGAVGTSRGTGGDNGGGGGGGSGGACLIKGDIVTLGTNKVTVAGGDGGTGASGTESGGDGGTGRIAVQYGSEISGSTSPSYDETNDPILAVDDGGLFANNL